MSNYTIPTPLAKTFLPTQQSWHMFFTYDLGAVTTEFPEDLSAFISWDTFDKIFFTFQDGEAKFNIYPWIIHYTLDRSTYEVNPDWPSNSFPFHIKCMYIDYYHPKGLVIFPYEKSLNDTNITQYPAADWFPPDNFNIGDYTLEKEDFIDSMLAGQYHATTRYIHSITSNPEYNPRGMFMFYGSERNEPKLIFRVTDNKVKQSDPDTTWENFSSNLQESMQRMIDYLEHLYSDREENIISRVTTIATYIKDCKNPNTKTYTNSTWSTNRTWHIKVSFSLNKRSYNLTGSNVVNYEPMLRDKYLLVIYDYIIVSTIGY